MHQFHEPCNNCSLQECKLTAWYCCNPAFEHYYVDLTASSRLWFYDGSSISLQAKPFLSTEYRETILITKNMSAWDTEHLHYSALKLLVSPVTVQNCNLCRTVCYKHKLYRWPQTYCYKLPGLLEVQPYMSEAQWGTVHLNALSQEVRSFKANPLL